jgi:hypothetical protein
MGFFGNLVSGVASLGKKAVSTVASVGKSVGGAVKSIGKGALGVASAVSSGLDTAVNTVHTVANAVHDIPIVGTLATMAMDTPMGMAVKSAFGSVEEANIVLKESVSIGHKIEKFEQMIEDLGVEGLKNPSNRLKVSNEIINISRDIAKSKAGKKISSIPQFKKKVDQFNKISNKVQGKIGKDNVEKIKGGIRKIANQPPPMPIKKMKA